MRDIWICSDWHFGHDKDFVWKKRGFGSVEEMNKEIVRRHNELVKPDDFVYCLGDCMLGVNVEGLRLISELNGKKYIILGNHDTDIRADLYQSCVDGKIINTGIVWVGAQTIIKHIGHRFLLNHYPVLCSSFEYGKPLKNCLISVCEHTHTQDRFADCDKGIIYHCEMDAHDCRPVHISQIVSDLNYYHR